MFLGGAEGLGIDHDLVFGIDTGHPVVTLDHTFAGLDLGAFIIGDVALDGGAAFAGFVVMVIEPGLDFSGLILDRLRRLPFSCRLLGVRRLGVGVAMALEDGAGGLLHPFPLLLELPFGATPGLGGITR